MDRAGDDKAQDALYRELVQAIYDEDFGAILRAKERGARFDYVLNDSDDPNSSGKTPAGHSVQFRFPYLIRSVLDYNLQEIPLGEVKPDGTRINVLDGLVDSVPSQPHEQCLEGLAKCLDLDAPLVVRGMWAAAERALALDEGRPYPESEKTKCATDILRYGPHPTDPADYLRILSTPVEQGATNAVPVMLINRIDNTFETAVSRWLENGFDPNASLHGMPLLHWFSIESNCDRIVARLVAAGADIHARSSYELFDQVVPAFVRAETLPVGEPCSAIDIAREMQRPDTCRVIEAALAKHRIDQVIARAKKPSPN